MPNTVIKAPIPIRVPNSFPNRVPQPYGYNPSPLQPPADYYVTRKEVKELLESVNLPNPGDPSQTDKFATREWVKDTTGLQGTDDGKTVREVAAEETAKIVDGAPAAFDTLKEVANWIQDDTTGAAAMAAAIAKNTAAVDELKERPVVEVVEPTPDGAGKAADAKAVYEGLERKTEDVINAVSHTELHNRKKDDLNVYTLENYFLHPDCLPITGASGYTDFKFMPDTPYDGRVMATRVSTGERVDYASLSFDQSTLLFKEFYSQIDIVFFNGKPPKAGVWPKYEHIYSVNNNGSLVVSGMLSDYSPKRETLPRYPFKEAEYDSGTVIVEPFTNSRRFADGAPFTIAVGGESDYMRDCVLRVECGETVPKITWGDKFHPRTDAETDFACAAGVRNVYWITEYAEGEFAVAGWRETDGGGTSNGGAA